MTMIVCPTPTANLKQLCCCVQGTRAYRNRFKVSLCQKATTKNMINPSASASASRSRSPSPSPSPSPTPSASASASPSASASASASRSRSPSASTSPSPSPPSASASASASASPSPSASPSLWGCLYVQNLCILEVVLQSLYHFVSVIPAGCF